MFFQRLNISHSAALAPLAGITDSAFRTLCRRFSAAFTMSEMVSAEGLVRESGKTMKLMRFSDEERPYGIQFFSHNTDIIGEAVKIAEELEPDFIDLNAGCPARKVVKKGAGAELMNDPERFAGILHVMRSATDLPLTVKIRAGDNPTKMNAPEMASIAEDCGVDAVIVHPRFRNQGFRGGADWSIIARVKETVSIPVIGNGDVKSPRDVEEMFRTTGCDLALIGRGALGAPWLFAQISGAMGEPSREMRRRTVREHYRLLLANKGEYVGVREMRKHLGWYSKSLKGAADFRRQVMTMESSSEVFGEIDSFFSQLSYALTE